MNYLIIKLYFIKSKVLNYNYRIQLMIIIHNECVLLRNYASNHRISINILKNIILMFNNNCYKI